jgi:hypothetical protein
VRQGSRNAHHHHRQQEGGSVYAWSLYDAKDAKSGQGSDHVGVGLCMLGGEITPELEIRPASNSKPKLSL